MAQQLWLLRHGEAEPHDARSDFDRRLTPRGEDQSRSAGRALASLEVEFQLAFSSPRVRALDTAKLACAELGIEPVVHEPLSGGFELADARELLAAAGADRRILLVGHEPDLSMLVRDLTGGTVDIKKGGVAGVRVDGSRAELIALLRPRELDRIG
jgi:phosphohistidine phosphatase